MAEQGWPAVERPEDDGGLGLGLVEVAVLCEQLGRHLAPVPFAGTVVAQGAIAAALASGALEGAGGGATRALGDSTAAEWARRLSTGEAAGAVAWSRRADAVRARRDDDGTVAVDRSVRPGRSTDPAADVLVVFAETGGGPAVFALAAEDAGARPRDEPAMDRTRSIGWLELDNRPAVAARR